MTDLQAAIGIHQLKRIETNWKKRQHIWQTYNQRFAHLPCVLPVDSTPDSRHAYHLYTPLVEIEKLGRSRDWVLKAHR